jgi:hypothetical protein
MSDTAAASSVVGWGRGILGLFLLPVAPFFSAILWRATRRWIGAATFLTLSGYLVFFAIAMGWGALLVFLGMVVGVIGGTAAWRARRPRVALK